MTHDEGIDQLGVENHGCNPDVQKTNRRQAADKVRASNTHASVVEKSIQVQRDEINALACPLGFSAFQRSIHISLKHRYAYFEIPKVACSTIKLTLFRAELEDDQFAYSQNRQIHMAELSPLLTPMNLPDISERLGKLFKFCFVRDPANRLVSAYLDKIVRNKPQKKIILSALNRTWDSNHHITFEEFVGVICDTPPLTLNPHWGVQYYQVFGQNIAYDFTGHFETFESDFQKVLQHIAIDFRYFRSAKSHATRSSELASDLLTPELRRKIADVYKLDYEFFNY